jgi:tetratricopeptide (TPR) repeat protein
MSFGKCQHEPDAMADTHSHEINPFVFDPQISDPDLDLLFDFVIAATWKNAFEIFAKNTERMTSEPFWYRIKGHIIRCADEELADHLKGHGLIGFKYAYNELSAEEHAHLLTSPKPRPRGDLDAAQRVYAGRAAAIASEDHDLEKAIIQATLAIDPCATPLWLSLGVCAQRQGDQVTLNRCTKRFGLCVVAELEFGLFALRHGVQAAGINYLQKCLQSLLGFENAFPTIAVPALSALGVVHADLGKHEAAIEFARRAYAIGEANLASRKPTPHSGQEDPEPKAGYGPLDVLRLSLNVAFATVRAGQLEEADAQFREVAEKASIAGDAANTIFARSLLGLAEVSRRRGHDDRAIVFAIQGIERFGLRVLSDGRLTNSGGDPWRADSTTPLTKVSQDTYPDPNPESIDPEGTWFADCYSHLVDVIAASMGDAVETAAKLEACILGVAMMPIASTRRGKKLSELGTQLWRRKEYSVRLNSSWVKSNRHEHPHMR